MRTISMSRMIEDFGPRDYLAALRRRHRCGVCSREEFILSAAAAYIAARFPRRGAALLDSLDAATLAEPERRRLKALRSRIAHYPTQRHATCTLTMIVKDEEERLPEALDTADDTFDEIVVCDTGSSDHTVDIAIQYGARAVNDPWRGDFSHARNRAIDASTCDWIFWMDADDRLEPASAPLLRALWRTATPQAAAVCVVNPQRDTPPFDFIQVRLFPRREGLRFERAVHEQIMFSARRLGVPFSTHPQVRLVHTGYADPEVHRAKARRNLPMIRHELAKTPGDPSLLLSLGDSHQTLGEYGSALEAYRTIMLDADTWRINSDVFVQAHVNTALLHLRRGDTPEAKRLLLRTLHLDPTRAEAGYHLGVIAIREGDLDGALDLFLRAARTTPPLRLTAVNNLSVRLNAVWQVADILVAMHRLDEAVGVLVEATRTYPTAYSFYSLLGKAYTGLMRLREAAAAFMRSLALCASGNREAREGMAHIYELLGDPEGAARFLEGVAEPSTVGSAA